MVRFYLRALVVMSGAYWLGFGWVYLVPGWGEHFSFTPGVFWLFSVFLALALGTMHVLGTRWIPGPERWRVRQHAELLCPLGAADAAERCIAALKSLHHFQKVRTRTETVIEASTRTTWESWGERIRCELTPVDERHTRVTVSSRPSLWTTLADQGRNWANVLQVKSALSGLPETPGRLATSR